MNGEKSERIRLAGLWKTETRSGKTFYSGSFGPSAQLQLFTNSYKEGDPKKPDLILYVVKREKKEDRQPSRAEPENDKEWEDEIPF